MYESYPKKSEPSFEGTGAKSIGAARTEEESRGSSRSYPDGSKGLGGINTWKNKQKAATFAKGGGNAMVTASYPKKNMGAGVGKSAACCLKDPHSEMPGQLGG